MTDWNGRGARGTRDAFAACCRVGVVAWTSRLPEQDRDGFVEDVLDRYAATSPPDVSAPHTFFFYQIDVDLCVTDEQRRNFS